MLEFIGVILGLIYIYMEYRASIHLWVIGAIMPAVYAIVYFQAGIYAQCGIQIYYIIAAIYGWWMWKQARRKGATSSDDAQGITRISALRFVCLLLLAMLPSIPLYFLLRPFNADAVITLLDAYIAGLSMIAMWMLSRKMAEQWLAWLIVDIACVALYLYLSLTTEVNILATAGLYTLYSVLAIVGYVKWRKMADNTPSSKA
jgi:nicotinamide mononucleotide transporter